MKTRTVNVFSYLWQSVKTRWNGFFEHYKIKTAAGPGGLRTLFRGERRLFRPAVPGRSAAPARRHPIRRHGQGYQRHARRDGRRPAVDGRHVRRHAGLPDQRGLSGPAGEADRRTGGEDHRHARRIPVFRHGLDVAHAADRRDQPVGGHRRGAGLRAFDLLPADHRRGARHENVGAGLRSADDGRRVDDPAGQRLVRRGAHGACGVARNRRQPPADHLLFPRSDGRILDQRRNPFFQGGTPARFFPAHRGARRGGHPGRRIEFLAPVVHGPPLEGDHPRRIGACRDGRNLEKRPRARLCDGVELRQGRDPQPARTRLHGPRIGHDLPGRRTDGGRAERLRSARRGAAALGLLGHAALHGRPDLSGRRGGVPRRAGHRAGPGAQQMVDHRRMRRDDSAGLGPQPDGVHRIRVQIPARIQ